MEGKDGVASGRLLVVDDEPEFAELIRKIGERKDFVVQTLDDSRDFEETYRQFDPSVIVLDIIMPDMDGIEIIQWLRPYNSEENAPD